MSTWDSPEARFGDELRSLVEAAVRKDVPPRAVEECLQREAQRVRETRTAYRAFVYECPDPDCRSSYTHLIDREAVTCEECDDYLRLIDSLDRNDERVLRFACDHDAHTSRAHTVDLRKIRCAIHGDRMEVTESYTTTEGFGRV